VDGVLHVRSQSNLLVGTSTRRAAIDADGWMSTGDLVEERDGLLKFVGRVRENDQRRRGRRCFLRRSETVCLDADNVSDATVSALAIRCSARW
jgi:long-subunit acyl-CoA synthetase (AMP-forming)